MTYDDLSPRERDVVDLIALGYTIKSIAQRLVISKRTAHVHTFRIRRKIGTDDLLTWARKNKGDAVKEVSAQEIIDQMLEALEDRESKYGQTIANLVNHAVRAGMATAYLNCVIAIDTYASYDSGEYCALVKNELDRMMTRDQ